MDVYALIRQLRAGESERRIARALRLDRKTVHRYHRWAKQQGLLRGALPELAALEAHLRETYEQAPRRPTRQWDESQFFQALTETQSDAIVGIARRLLEWMKASADEVYWGTGTQNGSFNAIVRMSSERVANVLGVWTYGTLEIGFAYAKVYPPFDADDMRKEWLARMNQIEGVVIPADSYSRRPSVNLDVLADGGAFEQFTAVFEWVIGELRAARDQ